MRNRLVGAVAATAIAAAALVACSPPNENPSDVKVTDLENPTATFENGDAATSGATTSENADANGTGGAEGTVQEPAAQ
ncbi:hypothetical protein ACFWGD_02535 [Corynebacterium sp. NPDC060344]|uniref:hypothetical protein n=1 Tax=Corynebacterium sp. NPDC060344 TaxID=3347101 RepID=UPI0036560B3D